MRTLLLFLHVICSLGLYSASGDDLIKPTELVHEEQQSSQSGMPSTITLEEIGHRFLRGGTYSRGAGGSSYSSGSSHSSGSSYSSSSYSSPSYHSSSSTTYHSSSGYYPRSHSTTHYSTAGSLNPNVGLLLFGILFLCCPCCVICFAILHHSDNANRRQETEGFVDTNSAPNYGSNGAFSMAKGKFDDCVRNAKAEVERGWSQPQHASVEPHSGKYLTSYVDRTTQVQWNATLNLHFTRDFAGKGYKLSGEGHDVDGMTVIEDGHANCDGTAWWKERTVTGDIGLMVVSRGKFDFAKRTFQGNWLANSGEEAAYITFQAEERPPQFETYAAIPHPQPSAPPAFAPPASATTPQPSAPVEVPMASATPTVLLEDDDIPTVTASMVEHGKF